MRRFSLSILLLLVLAPAVGQAQSPSDRRVDVIDVSGALDNQAVSFIGESISFAAESGSHAVVVQIDSPGVVADLARFEALLEMIGDPPIPVVVWVGPAPAVAYGGALELLVAAPVSVAAPEARVGFGMPTIVAGTTVDSSSVPAALRGGSAIVETEVPGVVDAVSPTIRQVLEAVDGHSVVVDGNVVFLETGSVGEVVFHKPGFWARFLRLAVTPEAAFLFLVAGLTVAAFEFYAIGPGVAAAVAGVSLFLAGYGIAALPVRWWAFALALVGWWALTSSYQRGGVVTLTGGGALLTLVGGLWFVDGAPQLQMNAAVTVVIVAAVLLFYVFAMPTVARARFSTPTIGRDHLIGAAGTAVTGLMPDGVVEVDGARWRASSHRAAGIEPGDPVRIVRVDGPRLEVEPSPQTGVERENHS